MFHKAFVMLYQDHGRLKFQNQLLYLRSGKIQFSQKCKKQRLIYLLLCDI